MSGSDFGPGSNYKINTLQTFHTKVDFHTDGKCFTSFKVTYSQNGKSVSMENSSSSDAARMSKDLADGLAFAFSSWSTYDNWLWGNKCQAS
jgi:hypothetical protein